MFVEFVAEIILATPIVADRLVGDSLLAGISMARHGDWQRAVSELPIAHVENVPQMSVMLRYAAASKTTETITIYQSIMRDLTHDPDMAVMLDKMPIRSSLTAASGPLKNLGNTYVTESLSKVYFIGKGDVDAVERILGDTTFIGKEKARGYGQTVQVSVWPVRNAEASSNPWFGLVGCHNGRNVVLRPIPARLRPLLPAQLDFIHSNETWHNPYNRSYDTAVVEPCLTPPFARGESFDEHRIENELCLLAS